MPALKLLNFGGMIPAVDPGLLPDNHAQLATNAWVYSGAVDGFREPVSVYSLTNPLTRRVFRVPIDYYDKEHIPDSYWMEFENPDVDVIGSPVSNDQFDRFYWAQAQAGFTEAPRYNTKDRIATGLPPYLLGVPRPTVAPKVSREAGKYFLSALTGDYKVTSVDQVSAGVTPLSSETGAYIGQGVLEARAYVYTWVTAFGEEGPPSPSRLVDGWSADPWVVKLEGPTPAESTDRALEKVRIYRTITAVGGSTTYFFVDELDIGQTLYIDTNGSDVVSANSILSSLFYDPPPADLEGLVTLPNGLVAGWRSNEIWFCEPYKPHAWPSPYSLSTEFPIVGLGAIGQTLIVCTSGSLHAVSGVNPANMAMSRISANEPCLSRASIVSSSQGVFYASPNGLALAAPGVVNIVTRDLITKDLWSDEGPYLKVDSLRSVLLNGGYYTWGSVKPGCFQTDAFQPDAFLQEDFSGARSGAFIDFSNQRVSWVNLNSESPNYNCILDPWTGETFFIRDGEVQWLDLARSRPSQPYVWKSKRFELPNQRNLGAMRVRFQTSATTPALNPVQVTSPATLAADMYGIARVYADGVLRFSRELRVSNEIFRLPSGFKAQHWEVEIEARVKLLSIEVANAAKELAGA